MHDQHGHTVIRFIEPASVRGVIAPGTQPEPALPVGLPACLVRLKRIWDQHIVALDMYHAAPYAITFRHWAKIWLILPDALREADLCGFSLNFCTAFLEAASRTSRPLPRSKGAGAGD